MFLITLPGHRKAFLDWEIMGFIRGDLSQSFIHALGWHSVVAAGYFGRRLSQFEPRDG